MTMSSQKKRKSFNLSLWFRCFCTSTWFFVEPSKAKDAQIPVGVVVDLNSSIGNMATRCIRMAHQDFYENYPHYQTRLDLRIRDSEKDVVRAASAAFDLIKNDNMHAIIGPLLSEQARFVIQLGNKYQVPIISFSATSPSLSSIRSKFFVRTAQDDRSQVEAIAEVVEAYGWHEIILIYEDSEYGNGLIPYLTDALDKVNTRVPKRMAINPNSQESEILEELKKLNQSGTRIYLVHMTSVLGPKFFLAANKAGMMKEGYGWIVTDGLSNVLDPLGPKVMDSMQGVLGIRPKVEKSRRLTSFRNKWKALSDIKPGSVPSPLTLFGLWAYDTVWAIAMAIESTFANSRGNETLIDKILNTDFQGLSGDFNLSEGQLKPLELEVFNVVGRKERVIGRWRPQGGLFHDNHWSSREKLMPPIWPGDTTNQPTKLRIGVPVRKRFLEFLKVERRSSNSPPDVSGFAIDVFNEVIKALPFPLPYEFLPFQKKNGESTSYEELVLQIEKKVYDAVVGDITIVANRAEHVDFTLPFTESGVSMVVSMKHDERQNMWIFLKPLSPGLWLTTGAAFILTGIIIWLHERRTNTEFQGSPQQQLSMMFWFSFSTLVFAHKERLVNNWSRFVLILWVFVVLIITQSYTASLGSMLTVQRLQPKFIDVSEIKKNDYCVGHQKGSFIKKILKNQLEFEESKLKAYEMPEEYDRALSSGEVAAFFDEIPYLKLFLSKYGSKYAMVGPTYKTAGFAFAFPLKSPLVSYFSRAILNVTQDEEKFDRIRRKYFSSEIISEDESKSSIPNSQTSLTVSSFGGLFIITGVTSGISLIFYLFKFIGYSQSSEERYVWLLQLKARIMKCLDRKDSSLSLNRGDSRIFPANNIVGDTAQNEQDQLPSPEHSEHQSSEQEIKRERISIRN